MSERERKTMLILADTLVGEINRMCVTKDLSEFDTMYGHAKKNLDKLSKMIYDGRFKKGEEVKMQNRDNSSRDEDGSGFCRWRCEQDG